MELNERKKLAVFGLGYVGLPLAVAFAKHYRVVGYDTNLQRVTELNRGFDSSKEFQAADILKKSISFTNDLSDVGDCNVYIVAVPTPVSSANIPDLTTLYSATELVAKVLKDGDLVVFESTVYPGCTLNECVPILEDRSGLKLNENFFCGYSPERINPGDRERGIADIVKVVAGSCATASLDMKTMYGKIISAANSL